MAAIVVLIIVGTWFYGMHLVRKPSWFFFAFTLIVGSLSMLQIGSTVVKLWRLPLPMGPAGEREKAYRNRNPIAISERAIWLDGDDALLRLDSPSFRVAARLPWNGDAPSRLSSVSWSGQELFLSWSESYRGSRYAIAGNDGWSVAPRTVSNDDPNVVAFWSRADRAFIVTSLRKSNSRSFTWIDEKGTEIKSLTLETPIILNSMNSLCADGDHSVMAASYDEVCRARLVPGASWSCQKYASSEVADCPESQFDLRRRWGAWLTPSGIVTNPLPPALATRFTSRSMHRDVLLGAGEVVPRGQWTANVLSPLTVVGDGYVSARSVYGNETKALGHSREKELLLERYDAEGNRTASTWIGKPPDDYWLFPMGGDVVVLSRLLDEVARFDGVTLLRRDPPSRMSAFRDRLGHSFVREVAVVSTLLLLPLLLAVTALLRGTARFWLARIAAVASTVGVATAVALYFPFYNL